MSQNKRKDIIFVKKEKKIKRNYAQMVNLNF